MINYNLSIYIAFLATSIALITTAISLFRLNNKKYSFKISNNNDIIDVDDSLKNYIGRIKAHKDIYNYHIVITETEEQIINKYINNKSKKNSIINEI